MGSEVKEKTTNKNDNIKKLILVFVGLVIVGLVVGSIVTLFRSDDIKSVKRILKSKFYNIECLDSYCNTVMAEEGDKLKVSKVYLLDKDGKVVAKYKNKYNANDKYSRKPYQAAKNYFIMKQSNITDNKVVGYTINAKNGKELYKTKNILNVLTNNYVLMKEDKTYTILDKKGKEIYNNIKDYKTYNNGEIIYINIDDQYILLNSKGEQILNGYTVQKEVVNEKNEPLFLVVKDVKNSVYQYFNIKKGQVEGDVFENYVSSTNVGELIITKSDNGKKMKYTLGANGKQVLIENSFVKVDLVNELSEKIDTNRYNIYSSSLYTKNQNIILVDDKENKELGILNVDQKKFTKIYSYKKDAYSINSSVTKLNIDDDNAYLQISCNVYNCDKVKTYIYDMKNNEVLYKLEDNSLLAQKYTQYEDGYKMIKYSYSSSNTEYKGLYVLYDAKNKELFKSKKEIIVIDKEKKFGSDYPSSLILYSAKQKKALNSETSLANVITINDKKLFKYTDSNNYTVILNERGKEALKVKSGNYLKYSNTSVIYLDEKVVNIYDINTFKTRKYKLKNNEKLNDGLGEMIPPYRGTIFINNSTDNYIKVVNSRGKVLKTIKKAQINSVYQNNKNRNVFIIVKSKGKTGNLYGLYLAK